MVDVRLVEEAVREIVKLLGEDSPIVGAGVGGSRDKPKLVIAVRYYDPILISTIKSTVKSNYMLEDDDISIIETGEIEAFFREN